MNTLLGGSGKREVVCKMDGVVLVRQRHPISVG